MMSGKGADRREGAVSFESRIAAVALLTAVAVLVTASAAFIIEQWRAETLVNERTYAAVGRMLAANAEKDLEQGDQKSVQDVFGALSKLPKVQSADLIDAQGKLVVRYARPAN